MRRSPRPSTGRAAHPDRAVLAASFAEDVVLDLQCSADESVVTTTSSNSYSSYTTTTGTNATRSIKGVSVTGSASPKAAPRSQHHPKPIPKPRSGTAAAVRRVLGSISELIGEWPQSVLGAQESHHMEGDDLNSPLSVQLSRV